MKVQIKGRLVDIPAKKIYEALVLVNGGTIESIQPLQSPGPESPDPALLPYIIPGFIDSHVHIESSMLVPAEFARLAAVHGTVATVSDPHEIANVCGMEGVEFMIENGRQVPFKFFFGAPSCVPATGFETAGARLDAGNIRTLLQRPEIRYLSEMMNFPGVLNRDPEVMEKIQAAHRVGKPVDGHAPGLRGADARRYIDAGISTDHECYTREEALEKLRWGMKILIREGSAARNFDALVGLLHDFPDQMMFCSDDKHPDSLVAGHINQLCARAVALGIDIFKVLRAACLNPITHYGLGVGQLRAGDPADFVLLQDLKDFRVLQTWVDGQRVADSGRALITSVDCRPINRFGISRINPEELLHRGSFPELTPVIEAQDGQLVTNKLMMEGLSGPDPAKDLLQLVVVNRYLQAPVARALIKGFGLREGAIASSVAHDSHNIVAVGANVQSLLRAIQLIIGHKGGISVAGPSGESILPLPVAGLMSPDDGYSVAREYTRMDAMAKALGSSLAAPFMTLSFMALLVIPHLKLSDLGLFDGDRFAILSPA